MTSIRFICAGTPTPTDSRFGTCFCIETGGQHLLIDCGPAATWKLKREGIHPTQVSHLFITHHHFDHVADIPCFALCRWDQGADLIPPLVVRGLAPTKRIFEQYFSEEGCFAGDIHARLNDPGSQSVFANRGGILPRKRPSFDIADIVPGFEMEGNGWKISTARARHADPWLETIAYRMETADGVIMFTGDTQPVPPIAELAKGADVMVANCWDVQDAMDANGEWDGQTGTLDAARMAAESGASHLILAHMGPNLCKLEVQEQARHEMGKFFGGKISFSSEGDTYGI